MSQGITSLHRILKDITRQKILLSLDEKGSMNYTDLMNTVGITSTGKLNYHLKILNGLIAKDQDGCYSLTEKGKLSIRLLEEFCTRSASELEAPFPKGYIIVVGLFTLILLGSVFVLFIGGIITLERFILYIVTSVLGVVFLVVADKARRKRALSKPSSQMLGAKLSIIFADAFAGGIILFFVGGLLIGLFRLWIFGFILG